MSKAIENLVDDYYAFLRDRTFIAENQQTGWTEIQSPLLDVFNDTIDLFVKKENGHFLLSDDGQTIGNLDLSGVSISRSEKRRVLLHQILMNYGVRLRNEELSIEATEKNFPQRKLNLLSAISETNDLYLLAKPQVEGIFREDVQTYLEKHQVIYTPFFIARGSSGLEFTFDFQIASAKKEIVLKSFNSINKMNLPQFLYTWRNVKEVREKQTRKELRGLAVINDAEHTVKDEYLEALHREGADYLLWSEREKRENLQKIEAA